MRLKRESDNNSLKFNNKSEKRGKSKIDGKRVLFLSFTGIILIAFIFLVSGAPNEQSLNYPKGRAKEIELSPTPNTTVTASEWNNIDVSLHYSADSLIGKRFNISNRTNITKKHRKMIRKNQTTINQEVNNEKK